MAYVGGSGFSLRRECGAMAAGAKALYDHYIYQYRSLLGTRKVGLGQSRLRWLLNVSGSDFSLKQSCDSHDANCPEMEQQRRVEQSLTRPGNQQQADQVFDYRRRPGRMVTLSRSRDVSTTSWVTSTDSSRLVR